MNLNEYSEGLQFGYGVFETMLCKDNKIVHLDAHLDRLEKSLKYLNMGSIDHKFLLMRLKRLMTEKELSKFVVKVTCLKNGDNTDVIITSRLFPYYESSYVKGYRLGFSKNEKNSTNSLLQHKTTNIMSSIIEMKAIKEKSFDEMVHINENGHITEAIFANIFFIKSGVVLTPRQDCGVLPGIIRQKVINHCKKLDIPIKMGYYSIKDLEEADAVFLTSSILGIMPVKSFRAFDYDIIDDTITKILCKELLL